ncbi:Integrator complex subunit 8, partial [Caligus rogercresseyi]
LQMDTNALVEKVAIQAGLAVKKLESLLENSSVLESIRVHDFSSINLDPSFELKPTNSFRETILLELTSYYFFIEDYAKSKAFCLQWTAPPSSSFQERWHGYRLRSDALDTDNLILRYKSHTPFNMDLLRSHDSESLSKTIRDIPQSTTAAKFLASCLNNKSKEPEISLLPSRSPSGKSSIVRRRELISELLRELDPDRILAIIRDINKNHKKTISVHRLSRKWVPHDNNAMRDSVLKTNHELGDFLYVLNCKLTQLKNIGEYHRASELFDYCKSLVSIPTNIAHYLKRNPRNWIEEQRSSQSPHLNDTNLTILSLARLLNHWEWDYLATSPKMSEGRPIFVFSHTLALIALNTPGPTTNQNAWTPTVEVVKHCKALMDIMAVLFTAKPPQKRGALLQLILKIKQAHLGSILGQMLIHFINAGLEDSEVHNPFLPILPLENPGISVNMELVSAVLKSLCPKRLRGRHWSQALGELAFSKREFSAAMAYYLEALISSSHYFLLKAFEKDDRLVTRMIKCSSELGNHVSSTILCQLVDGVDYSGAFRSLEERAHNNDAMDGLYPYLWDVTVLEFAVTMHAKKGDYSRKKVALDTINNLEINTNNNDEILLEAAAYRRNIFLRKLAAFFLS